MKKKIFILTLILILIILFISIFFLKKFSDTQKIDDFLFLKLFSNGKFLSEDNQTFNIENTKEYDFKIHYKNINFKSINLSETIDKKTLVKDKIAPGTSGSFDILVESNQNLKYKITFNSINEKPKNLNFVALKNEQKLAQANTLEELSEKLDGYINKDEKINITINWYWDFESQANKEETDIQDTKDAENIRCYKFDLYALGEEI